jgi:hypothetical protein
MTINYAFGRSCPASILDIEKRLEPIGVKNCVDTGFMQRKPKLFSSYSQQ